MTLSNAERQARWRAKRDAEIERLRKGAARQQPAKAAAPSSELIAARKEIERLRKAAASAPSSSSDSDLQRTIDRLKAANKGLRMKVAATDKARRE